MLSVVGVILVGQWAEDGKKVSKGGVCHMYREAAVDKDAEW